MNRFVLEPIYGSLLFTVLAAFAVVTIIVLFTPEAPDPGKRRRLIALRSVAALVLLLASFGPSLIRTDNRPAEATLVVAVDTSRSMTLPDGDGNDRWTSQRQAWQALAAGLAELDESLSVKLITYDQATTTIDSVGPDALDTISPTGELTDLSSAAAAAINVVGGQPMAGVVLMGDGTQTSSVNDDGARRAAETLNALGVPLWCVPIGPAGGTTASRDVAITSVRETLSLFAGNEFDVSFQVMLRGLAGVAVPVRLEWIAKDGETIAAARRTVVASRANETMAIELALTAPPPGTYRLVVQADEQQGEWVTQNNYQIAFVDVREGGGRILYIEGMPRVEQTFLRRSLKRFPDLDLTYRWVPARTVSSSTAQPRTQWPIDFGDRFSAGKFDVYILGDIHADAIGDDQLAQLAETIGNGAGLITLGGFQAYGDGGFAESPLANVLPIDISEGGQIDGPLSIRVSKSHPITDMGGQSANDAWDELPALTGANRWGQTKPIPGVDVLLESEQGDALMVTGEYGRGRVASIAFDSTWRWWRAGKSDVHRRFWRQAMLWALSREDADNDQIQIEMDARRFTASAPPDFRARYDSLASNPSPVTLIAELIDESGQVRLLEVTESAESALQDSVAAIKGAIPELEPGFHTLRVRANEPSPTLQRSEQSSPTDPSSTIGPAELTFQVIQESRELERPMADPVYLQQLASLTSDHGGASFSVDEINQLLTIIAARRNQAEVPIVEKNRLGDGPISGWILFLLFAAAICTEWFLRRRWMMA
tara:strand:+ start:359821 stop:362130 length:2310 start_codon:yes stop_codon:yes gene_type:complete